VKNQREVRRSAADARVTTSRDVEPYLAIVRDVAARYARRIPVWVQRDDLFAAGAAGVFEALRRSEVARGPKFELYLRTRIRGAIIDELRAQDWLSRRARRQATAWAEGRSSRVGSTVIALEDVSEEVIGKLPDPAPSVEDELATQSEHAELALAVAALPDRERVVVTLHYMEDVEMKAIAARLGVSQARVSQLRSRAIRSLRLTLSHQAPPHAEEPETLSQR